MLLNKETIGASVGVMVGELVKENFTIYTALCRI